jgi:hypothetical protein
VLIRDSIGVTVPFVSLLFLAGLDDRSRSPRPGLFISYY